MIYGWDSENREMIARLDVGRLLPIRDVGMDDLSQKPLQVRHKRSRIPRTHNQFCVQVTLIHTAPMHIYIGTNWGFIFITDIKYLKPLTILQPFQDDIRSFWMFRSFPNDVNNLSSRRSSFASAAGSEVGRSEDQRETATPSPNPNSSKRKSDSVDITENENPATFSNSDDIGIDLNQLVIVLGKGFSSIINQNAVDDQRRKRIFGILWKINSNSSWN